MQLNYIVVLLSLLLVILLNKNISVSTNNIDNLTTSNAGGFGGAGFISFDLSCSNQDRLKIRTHLSRLVDLQNVIQSQINNTPFRTGNLPNSPFRTDLDATQRQALANILCKFDSYFYEILSIRNDILSCTWVLITTLFYITIQLKLLQKVDYSLFPVSFFCMSCCSDKK
jgi:hypothetical protein